MVVKPRPNSMSYTIAVVAVLVLVLAALCNPTPQPTAAAKVLAFTPEPGTSYRYALTLGSQSANSSVSIRLNDKLSSLSPTLSPNGLRMYFVLHRDYGEYVGSVEANNHTVRLQAISNDICEVASSSALLSITIESVSQNNIFANLTLEFIHGFSRCGANYSPMPISDAIWIKIGNSSTTSFAHLQFSRLVSIDKFSLGVMTSSGLPSGEWPFWLSNKDVNGTTVAKLYGLDDVTDIDTSNVTVQTPFTGQLGIATVLLLNYSEGGIEPFVTGSTLIAANAQVFSMKRFLLSQTTLTNVPVRSVDAIAHQISASFSSPSSLSYSRNLFFPRTVIVSGGLVVMDQDQFSGIDLTAKPWDYQKSLLTFRHLTDVGSQAFDSITTVPGIGYASKQYIAQGLMELDSVSYSNGGLLLYLRTNSKLTQSQILPSVLVRSFGIIQPFTFLDGQQVSLTLIDY